MVLSQIQALERLIAVLTRTIDIILDEAVWHVDRKPYTTHMCNHADVAEHHFYHSAVAELLVNKHREIQLQLYDAEDTLQQRPVYEHLYDPRLRQDICHAVAFYEGFDPIDDMSAYYPIDERSVTRVMSPR